MPRRRWLSKAALGWPALAALALGCATEPVRGPGVSPAPVAILISDDVGIYKEVADLLARRLVHVQLHALGGDADKAEAVTAKLRTTRMRGIVAIGALATRAAVPFADRPAVFCLDFTPEDERAGRAVLRGVQAQPPAFEQLQAWKRLDPRLARVAIVTGEDKSGLVRAARAAAARLGIELEHIEVRSDRELLYAVKRLPRDVQGVWFPPDSRIFSAAVLREVLGYALRRGKQTLVFSSQLLRYGALISAEADPRDVAERVLEQLSAKADVPRVLPLRQARTRVNLAIARRFGLAVPQEMQGGAHVF